MKKILSQLRHINIRSRRKSTDVFFGNYRSAFHGQGVEFHSLRPYENGDDVRRIDWKTSAKKDSLFVKKFQETHEKTVCCILDTSASMNFGTSQKKSETALLALALISFSALKDGEKCGALFYNNTLKYIPPKKHTKQLSHIIATGLQCFSHNQQQTADHQSALALFFKVQKKSSLCFYFTDSLLPLPEKQLIQISKKHELIIILLEDKADTNIQGDLDLHDNEDDMNLWVNSLNIQHIKRILKEKEKKEEQRAQELKKYKINVWHLATHDDVYKTLGARFKKYSKIS
ncbi:hypothetical protein COB57_02060 [Candidatus Peregrinibacteria bacterium]|nr:MAG: hypothetical protein COB57_02060 [Candidatus Peregrinibacteria bacterium]